MLFSNKCYSILRRLPYKSLSISNHSNICFKIQNKTYQINHDNLYRTARNVNVNIPIYNQKRCNHTENDSEFNNPDELIVEIRNRLKIVDMNNSENLIALFQQLDNLNALIPLDCAEVTIRTFSRSQDFTRIKTLLEILKSNYDINRHHKDSPQHSEDLSSLYSNLIRRSIYRVSKEMSFQAAIHISKSLGFKEDKDLMTQIIRGITTKKQVNIKLLKDIHQIMKNNVWDDSSLYYINQFFGISSFIRNSCATDKSLMYAEEYLNEIILDVDRLNNLENLEVYKIKTEILRCWVSLCMYESNLHVDNLGSNHISKAIDNFQKLLDISSVFKKESNEPNHNSDSIIQDPQNTDQNETLPTSENSTSNKLTNISWQGMKELFCFLSSQGNFDLLVGLLDKWLATIESDLSFSDNRNSIAEQQESPKSFYRKISLTTCESAISLITQILKHAKIKNHETKDLEAIFNELNRFYQTIEILCNKYNLKPSPLFCAVRIDSLFSQLDKHPTHLAFDFEKENLQQQLEQIKNWQEYLDYSTKIISDMKIIRTTPQITHAVVSGLCNTRNPPALHRAFEYLVETAKTNQIIPFYKTWALLLEVSSYCLSDTELIKMAVDINRQIDKRKPTGSSAVYNQPCMAMTRAEILANARLSRGLVTLELFRKLRREGGIANKISRKYYLCTVNSIYTTFPKTEEEWQLVSRPLELSEWFLKEMYKDGIKLDEKLSLTLLKLFIKNCQISRSRGDPEAALKTLHIFLDNITLKKSYLGQSRVKGTEVMYSNYIKAACLAGLEERAFEFIESMDMNYGISPKCRSFEPIIHYYSVVKGSESACETVLNMLLNNKININVSIVDSVVLGYLNSSGDHSETLDKVQDIFNQYGVRPSPSTLLTLLDISLKNKDVFEARRVVVIIQQIFKKISSSSPLEILSKHQEKIDKDSYNGSRKNNKIASVLLSQESLKKRFEAYGLYLDESDEI